MVIFVRQKRRQTRNTFEIKLRRCQKNPQSKTINIMQDTFILRWEWINCMPLHIIYEYGN